jgi:hypothetical protein
VSKKLFLWIGLLALVVPPLHSRVAKAERQTGPQTEKKREGMSGASTAGTFKPIKDSLSRPITAGGFVDGAPVVFTDITSRTGIGRFLHHAGTREKRYIIETPSGGVSLFDYDNDGWLDVYLVNGSTIAALNRSERPPRSALFHNNRDGTFSNVTDKAGVANERWGFGVAVGDYDNDGWEDFYVTNYGKNRLYHNNHDGTFSDMAEKLGVTVDGWSTGASFGDYDGDGQLDLFVAGYVDFDTKAPPEPEAKANMINYCVYRGQPVMCGPRGLKGARDYLFRNNGKTFTEVSEKAGVADRRGYYGFGVAFCDVDDDGKLYIVVANDSTPNYLYRNRGDGTFEDVSYISGFALNESGREQASMGLAIGDYDNDGRVDLYVTNFSDDSNTLYHNDADGLFTDVTFQAGHGETTIPFLGWGAGFLDYDNDGLLDVFVANGHVYPQVDRFDWGTTWAQRPLLLRNTNGSRFDPVVPATGSGLAVVVPARGAAFGDIDNDGRIDVVMNNCGSAPTVLHNEAGTGNHWLTVKLTGRTRGPRDAIGATAYLVAGGKRQRRDVISGASYLSQSDLRLHFGLGRTTKVDRLEIRWPSGARQTVEVKDIDRQVTVTEGGGGT